MSPAMTVERVARASLSRSGLSLWWDESLRQPPSNAATTAVPTAPPKRPSVHLSVHNERKAVLVFLGLKRSATEGDQSSNLPLILYQVRLRVNTERLPVHDFTAYLSFIINDLRLA